MIYKDIIPKDSLLGNIPSFPRYHVTTEGEVYSLKNKGWQKLKLIKNIDGYLVAYLSNEKHSSKHHFVHRLVLTVFKGEPPPNMECRHLDGKRDNNHIDNLKWGTKKENEADKILHGTRNSIVTKDTVLKAFDLRSKNLLLREIAEYLNLSIDTISCILNRRMYSEVHVDEYLIINHTKKPNIGHENLKKINRKFSENKFQEMIDLYSQGLPVKEISKKFQISQSYFGKILKKRDKKEAVKRPPIKRSKINNKIVERVFSLYAEIKNKAKIAKILSISRRTVILILQRKIWSEVEISKELLEKAKEKS